MGIKLIKHRKAKNKTHDKHKNKSKPKFLKNQNYGITNLNLKKEQFVAILHP
jgi:hypothetical protein